MGQTSSENLGVRASTFNDPIREISIDDLPGSANDDPNEWQARGYVYYDKRMYSESHACYERALKLQGDHEPTWFAKGDLYLVVGRNEDAQKCFDKVVQLNSRNGQAWNSKGNALNKLKRYSEALEAFGKALELRPKDALVWFNKGFALMKQAQLQPDNINDNTSYQYSTQTDTQSFVGKHSEAIHCFLQSVSIDKNAIKSWFYMGRAYELQNSLNEALKCYSMALKIDPSHKSSLNHKGMTYMKLDKYPEAAELFRAAIEVDRKNLKLWNELGNALYFNGDYEEALTAYKEALTIFPGYAQAMHNKELAEEARKKRSSVSGKGGNKQSLSRKIEPKTSQEDPANKKNKNSTITFYQFKESIRCNNQGCDLYKMQDYAAAIQCFNKSLEYNPQNIKALNNIGLALKASGALDESIIHFTKVLELNKKSVTAWINQGNAYISLENYLKAIECFDCAISIDKNNPIPWNNKGYAFSCLKDYENAESCFLRALQMKDKTAQFSSDGEQLVDMVTRNKDLLKVYFQSSETNVDAVECN